MDAPGSMVARLFDRASGETEGAVAEYVGLAKKHGLDPAQMALAFVRQQPFVSSTLLGATTLEQLKSNIESRNLVLNEDVLKAIEEIHSRFTYPAP